MDSKTLSRCHFMRMASLPRVWVLRSRTASKPSKALACGPGEIAVAGQQLADAEFPEVVLVLEECRSDDGRARSGGELNGEAADAARCANDERVD